MSLGGSRRRGDPILALNPKAWFRADDWSGALPGLPGRVGTEGNYIADGGIAAPTNYAPANNQPFLTLDGANAMTSSQAPAFWDFLGSDAFTAYVVTVPDATSTSFQIYTAGTATELEARATDGTIFWRVGDTAQYIDLNTTGYDFAGLPVLNRTRADGTGDPQAMLDAFDLSSTAVASNSGPFNDTPPGTVDGSLITVSALGTDANLAGEWLFFDRALSVADDAIVLAYMINRYRSA